MSSLLQSWSFDHGQCDALLQRSGLDVGNSYSASKHAGFFYSGFWYGLAWLALVAGSLVVAWRSKNPKYRTGRFILPFFLLFGFVSFYALLQDMAHYVDVCRAMLHVAPNAPALESPDLPRPLAFVIFVAFVGALVAMTVATFQRTTSLFHRIPAVIIAVAGAVLLTYFVVDVGFHSN